MLYQLKIYKNDGREDIDKFNDEDALRHSVDEALDKVEAKEIKTFCVSWIKENYADKPWWQDE